MCNAVNVDSIQTEFWLFIGVILPKASVAHNFQLTVDSEPCGMRGNEFKSDYDE